MYTKCIAYVPCRNAYLSQLKAVSAMATKMKLSRLMKSATNVIRPTLVAKNNSDQMEIIALEQASTLKFITTRQKEVAALVKKYKIK
jgi:hypothetical protein